MSLEIAFKGKRVHVYRWRKGASLTLICALHHDTKKVNILDEEFSKDSSAISPLLSEDGIGCLIICSRHSSSFLHGGDVKLQSQFKAREQAKQAVEHLKSFFDVIEALPYPTISLINSTCLGGGLELALACDYRFASQSCKAIGLPEVQLGILPGAGGVVRLARLIGLMAATPLLLSGQILNASKAKGAGIVDLLCEDLTWPVESKEPKWLDMVAALQLQGRFNKALSVKSKYKHMVLDKLWPVRQMVYSQALKQIDGKVKRQYPAPYVILQTLFECYFANFDDALKIETAGYLKLAETAEAQSLMSLFVAKSDIKARALAACHVDEAAEPPSLGVFVLGAGWMGSGIGQRLAAQGAHVTMYDVTDDAIETAKRRVHLLFRQNVKTRSLKEEQAISLEKAIVYTTQKDFAAFERQSLAAGRLPVIIEAAPELLSLKQQLFEEMLSSTKSTILATNTSSIPIDILCSKLAADVRPRVIGLHFFHPEHNTTPVVEIIPSSTSSVEAKQAVAAVSLKMQKIPVVVGDAPAFVVNCIATRYYGVAGHLAIFGAASPQRIDRCMEDNAFANGPFSTLDGIGLKTADSVSASIFSLLELPSKPVFAELLSAMTAKSWTGRSFDGTSTGFYTWKNGVKTGVNQDLKALLQVVHSNMDAQSNHTEKALFSRRLPQMKENEIFEVIMLAMAARLLDLGVAASAQDVDFLMVAAMGVPPMHGLLLWADRLGLNVVVERLSFYHSTMGAEELKPAAYLERLASGGDRFFPEAVPRGLPQGAKNVSKWSPGGFTSADVAVVASVTAGLGLLIQSKL